MPLFLPAKLFNEYPWVCRFAWVKVNSEYLLRVVVDKTFRFNAFKEECFVYLNYLVTLNFDVMYK